MISDDGSETGSQVEIVDSGTIQVTEGVNDEEEEEDDDGGDSAEKRSKNGLDYRFRKNKGAMKLHL